MQKKQHVLTPSPYKSISVTWLITETFLCSRDSQRNVCSERHRWPAVTRQSFAGRFLLLFYINKKANAAHREEVLYEGKWWEHVRGTVTQNRACQWQKKMRRSKSAFTLWDAMEICDSCKELSQWCYINTTSRNSTLTCIPALVFITVMLCICPILTYEYYISFNQYLSLTEMWVQSKNARFQMM